MLRDLSHSWLCSGMLAALALAGTATVSGQPGLAQTGTPPPAPDSPSHPCHLLTSAQNVPDGFGAAYNVFSASKELLLNVECGSSSDAVLTVGNGQNTTYIYRFGYEWQNGGWKQIALGGPQLVATDWYVGTAKANLMRSQAQLAEDNFVVAYTCLWQNNSWKCGCRDQSCSQNYWQLQAFRQASPTGGSGAGTSNDTGISDAPLKPVNDVVKTVCSSGCDYNKIPTALAAAKPGWTIQVKNGTYTDTIDLQNKSCTKAKPCALMAFPGHKPVISTTKGGVRFLRSDWWIIDGFEITNSSQPSLNIGSSHMTVRNNHIHDNPGHYGGGGIHPGSHHVPEGSHHLLIENNRIGREGLNGCEFGSATDNKPSPRHCHGIYVIGTTPDQCYPRTYITVRRNFIYEQGGSAMQIRAQHCGSDGGLNHALIENNVMYNNASVFNIAGGNNVTIRNNTFVTRSWPKAPANAYQPGVATSFQVHLMEAGGSSPRNYKYYNNIWHSTHPDVYSLTGQDGSLPHLDTFQVNYNVWGVTSNKWTWGDADWGFQRTDFKSAYRSVTGWDKDGKCCNFDPKFVGTTDFRLQASSPARNAGLGSMCPSHDFAGNPRDISDGFCDAGAFEYRP